MQNMLPIFAGVEQDFMQNSENYRSVFDSP
jgi:hypothetical protein